MLDLVGNIFNNLGAKKMGRENNPFWIDPKSVNHQYFKFVLVFIIESFYLCRTNISSVCFVCTTHQMQTLSNKLDHIPCIETVNNFYGIVGMYLLWTDLLKEDWSQIGGKWWIGDGGWDGLVGRPPNVEVSRGSTTILNCVGRICPNWRWGR